MEINLPITQDLTLRITDKPNEQSEYPSSRLQKGLLMSTNDMDLAEEAVGFGLPVLKRGLQTFFPGSAELNLLRKDSICVVMAVFTVNLVERISKSGRTSIDNKSFYFIKNSLATIIRHFPFTRGFLTSLSSELRGLFGWQTTYEYGGQDSKVEMTYTFDKQTGSLAIEADLACFLQGSVTEVIIMNEQGAHHFDKYHDSSGMCLSGKAIGCWNEVRAREASFESTTNRVIFTLPRMPEAQLFRGREVIGNRVAWAGFGYACPPTTRRFSYTVKIDKLP